MILWLRCFKICRNKKFWPRFRKRKLKRSSLKMMFWRKMRGLKRPERWKRTKRKKRRDKRRKLTGRLKRGSERKKSNVHR